MIDLTTWLIGKQSRQIGVVGFAFPHWFIQILSRQALPSLCHWHTRYSIVSYSESKFSSGFLARIVAIAITTQVESFAVSHHEDGFCRDCFISGMVKQQNLALRCGHIALKPSTFSFLESWAWCRYGIIDITIPLASPRINSDSAKMSEMGSGSRIIDFCFDPRTTKIRKTKRISCCGAQDNLEELYARLIEVSMSVNIIYKRTETRWSWSFIVQQNR